MPQTKKPPPTPAPPQADGARMERYARLVAGLDSLADGRRMPLDTYLQILEKSKSEHDTLERIRQRLSQSTDPADTALLAASLDRLPAIAKE